MLLPLYIVGGLIFAGVVVIFVIYYGKSMKMTSFIEGRVISAEERVVRDESERREETALLCAYTVRGDEFQITHILRGHRAKAYPPGKPITVWYNPTEPHMAKIKDAV